MDDYQDTLVMNFISGFISGIIFCLILYLVLTKDVVKIYYSCDISEFSPDVPIEVRTECRKLRSKM
jgi:hypothetical protein